MRNFSRTLSPEHFDATVAIDRNGGYTYSYEGTLIFVPALMRSAQATVCARYDAQLKKLAMQLLQEGFRKAQYLGDGRYFVIFEGVRANNEPLYFLSREMPAFRIMPQLDGAIMIGAFRSDSAVHNKFIESVAGIDGTLSVRVDNSVKVLGHNAQDEPSIHGQFAEYSWGISSPDADPYIIVQPAQ